MTITKERKKRAKRSAQVMGGQPDLRLLSLPRRNLRSLRYCLEATLLLVSRHYTMKLLGNLPLATLEALPKCLLVGVKYHLMALFPCFKVSIASTAALEARTLAARASFAAKA